MSIGSIGNSGARAIEEAIKEAIEQQNCQKVMQRLEHFTYEELIKLEAALTKSKKPAVIAGGYGLPTTKTPLSQMVKDALSLKKFNPEEVQKLTQMSTQQVDAAKVLAQFPNATKPKGAITCHQGKK